MFRLDRTTITVLLVTGGMLGVMLGPPVLNPPAEPSQRLPVSPTRIDWPSPTNSTQSSGPTFDAVYPNPIPAQDRGEYVTVSLPASPPGTNWTVSDNETTAPIPGENVSGTLLLTATPTHVRKRPNQTVIALDPPIALANAGEQLTLRRNGTVVDTITYPATGEYEIYENGTLHPRGITDYPAWSTNRSPARSFVLPDSPQLIGDILASADHRLYIAGYTLTSRRLVSQLITAATTGVDVRVLFEGGIVGGTSRRTVELVSRLQTAGVDVRVIDGPRSRWRFHHAKYAVVDNHSLILTENWQPAGTGGHATRGWGTVITDAHLANRLATVFRKDHAWRGTRSWTAFANETAFQPASPATDSFYTRFPAQTTTVAGAQLLVAPDNAERRLRTLLQNADESIRVLQPEIGNRTPLLAELVHAARRGVDVRILVGGTWFLAESNQHLIQHLRRVAKLENLPLEIRLIEPRSRFEYLHAKGVIIDGDQVVVGSINWNTVSTRQNREVAVLVNGSSIGTYYSRVFRADWRGAAWRLPIGVGVIAVLTLLTGIGVVSRVVTFGGPPAGPRQVQRRPSSRLTRQEQPPASQERT